MCDKCRDRDCPGCCDICGDYYCRGKIDHTEEEIKAFEESEMADADTSAKYKNLTKGNAMSSKNQELIKKATEKALRELQDHAEDRIEEIVPIAINNNREFEVTFKTTISPRSNACEIVTVSNWKSSVSGEKDETRQIVDMEDLLPGLEA